MDNYNKLISLFNEFLLEFLYYVCPRCYPKKTKYGKLSENDVKIIKNKNNKFKQSDIDNRLNAGHHNGIINNYILAITKLDKDFLDNFFNDVEHGFFHGLMVAFMVYVINNDRNVNKNKNYENDFISALLHDFLKCNNYNQDLHDKELVKFFDKLLPETYIHSNPPEKYENSILISSDRLELRRYSDYKDWVDERFYKLYEQYSKETQVMINIFYENVRPVLEYMYKNRNKVFIRHGIEENNYEIGKTYPTMYRTAYYDYFKDDTKKIEDEKYYAIEIDRLPFSSNIDYNDFIDTTNKVKDRNNKKNGYCSNHDSFSMWNKLKGYITHDDFISNDGEIIIDNCRDHLFAKSSIDINKWVFLFKNIEKDNKHLNNLIKNNIPIAPQNTIFLFSKLVKLLSDRLIILNVKSD